MFSGQVLHRPGVISAILEDMIGDGADQMLLWNGIEIAEDATAHYYRIDVPGCTGSYVQISLNGSDDGNYEKAPPHFHIDIHRPEPGEGEPKVIRSGIKNRNRSFALVFPGDGDPKRVTSSIQNGVLTIKIMRETAKESVSSRRIPITTES